MFDRFGRKYELKIITLDDKEITITPELRITFDVTKSIKGSLNKATVQIYNLSQTNRDKIKKDEDPKPDDKDKPKETKPKETKPKDENSKRELPPDYMQFELKAGYSKIETIFKGAISIAKSKREGSNFATTIEAYDGLYDMKNSYTSKVVKGNVSSQIIQDMPTVKQGKVTEQNPLLRPRVLVGNSFKLIEQNLEENETFYIDDGVIHIIKDKEVTSSYIPLVSAATGLLNSPDLAEKEVFFETQMNPLIKIGCLIQLESLYEKRLNGIYKVNTIHYTGDYAGQDWKQEVFCVACNDYKVIK